MKNVKNVNKLGAELNKGFFAIDVNSLKRAVFRAALLLAMTKQQTLHAKQHSYFLEKANTKVELSKYNYYNDKKLILIRKN